MTKQKRNRKHFHILLAVCMAVLVIVLDVCFILLPDREASETENRNLQQFPAMTWNTVTSGRFETLFDRYVADQFPGRNGWIGIQAAIARMAGNTVSHDIFLGKNGYLIQRFEEPSEEEYDRMLGDFSEVVQIVNDIKQEAGTAPEDAGAEQEPTEYGEETGTEQEAEEQPDGTDTDIRVYALIAPTAVSVLKDQLPANAYPMVSGDEDAFLDRLFADLQDLGIESIDVRPALQTLKDSGTQVYYRTDHHWTTDAAYEAWKEFAAAAQLPADHVTYDRLAVTDQFQGTLSASSGFRTDQKDMICMYMPREIVPGEAPSPEAPEEEELADGSEEAAVGEDTASESGGLRYLMVNRDTGEKRSSLYDTSFLDTRDKYAFFMGGNHGEVKIQTSADTDRNILVLKDSYANCLIPFLLPDFQNILVVDPRYYLGSLEQLIRDEGITDVLFLYNAETM